MIFDIVDQLVGGVSALWWLFALVGMGSGIVVLYYFLRNTTKLEIPVSKNPTTTTLPPADSFLAERDKARRPVSTEDDHSERSSFKAAVERIVVRALDEADVKLEGLRIPIFVEGDEMKAKVEGKIGDIVVGEKKGEAAP